MDFTLKKRIVGILILVAAALILVPLFFSNSVPSSELQLSAHIPKSPVKLSNLALAIPSKEAMTPSLARTDQGQVSNPPIVFEPIPLTPNESGTTSPTNTTPSAANPSYLPQTTTINTSKMQSNAVVATPAASSPTVAKTTVQTQQTTPQTPPLAQQTAVSTVEQPTISDNSNAVANQEMENIPPAPITKSKTASKAKNTAASPQAWAVQLGSFSDKINAEKLMKKLQSQGLPAYVRTTKTTKGNLIRVLVGPELHKTDANKLLNKLQTEFNLKGMVVKAGV